MKKSTICFLFFLTFSVSSFALESYIVKKDGTRQNIKSNSFRIDQTEKVVYYKTESNQNEVRLSFNDITSVEFGTSKFKIFRFDGKNPEGYFVLAEADGKSLVSIYRQDDEDEDSKILNYEFYIIDNKNKVMDSHFFTNEINQKNIDLRSDIFMKIKFHFGSCPSLIKVLELYDKSNDSTQILEFFRMHAYYTCNQLQEQMRFK